MKKLLLILCLSAPLFSLAEKYYQGKITKKDGTIITGFFQYPDHSLIKNVKYKLSINGKKEKIKSEELKTLEFTNENDVTYKFERYYTKGYSMFNRETMKKSKKEGWFRVLEKNENTISIFGGEFKSSDGKTTNYATHSFMLIPGDTEIIRLELVDPGDGFNIKIGFYSNFVKIIEIYFKEICPSLHKQITKVLYNEKGVFVLPRLYKDYCN